MYFLTLKFSRRTAVGMILAAAALLIALVIIFSGGQPALETTEERVNFLSDMGWEVDPASETDSSVLIPREFSDVYARYNELQKQQGYDLEQFCGMTLELYTYVVTNYSTDGTVIAALYLYDGQVVGGDIHSTELNGFMHGLK